MEFFKELFNVKELVPFISKIAGTSYMLLDFLFIVIGTYLLQRIIFGKSSFFLLFVMTTFTVLFHYNTDTSITHIVMQAYQAKGIGFFRQEIFVGVFILFFVFIARYSESDSVAILIPLFIMIEILNIYGAFDHKEMITEQLFPFWGVLIVLGALFLGVAQGETDRKIEERILDGSASESDAAYYYKRKREREDEYWQE